MPAKAAILEFLPVKKIIFAGILPLFSLILSESGCRQKNYIMDEESIP